MSKPLIKWQTPMRRVLYALAPLVIASVYCFGWQVLLLLLIVNAAGFFVEQAFTRRWDEPVSSAVFVTATLFALSLPPRLPVWMALVGVVFAVVFGKMVFGGFGRNVFNPALTGRAFLYISFGLHMTGQWYPPVPGPLGGLAAWAPAPDAVTTATPGMLMKAGQWFSVSELWLGRTAGVIGGTSAILTLLCGLYLVWTRTANYRIVVSGFLGFSVIQTLLWLAGVPGALDPLRAAAGGSLIFGLCFYATDPVSASQTDVGRWLYGAFVGAMSSVIALYSAWPAGTMFAILLANMLAPITDYAVRNRRTARKQQP